MEEAGAQRVMALKLKGKKIAKKDKYSWSDPYLIFKAPVTLQAVHGQETYEVLFSLPEEPGDPTLLEDALSMLSDDFKKAQAKEHNMSFAERNKRRMRRRNGKIKYDRVNPYKCAIALDMVAYPLRAGAGATTAAMAKLREVTSGGQTCIGVSRKYYYEILKTEPLMNKRNPTFPEVRLNLEELVYNDDNVPFYLECWDHDDDTIADDFIGMIKTTVAELRRCSETGSALTLKCPTLDGEKSGGKILVQEMSIEEVRPGQEGYDTVIAEKRRVQAEAKELKKERMSVPEPDDPIVKYDLVISWNIKYEDYGSYKEAGIAESRKVKTIMEEHVAPLLTEGGHNLKERFNWEEIKETDPSVAAMPDSIEPVPGFEYKMDVYSPDKAHVFVQNPSRASYDPLVALLICLLRNYDVHKPKIQKKWVQRITPVKVDMGGITLSPDNDYGAEVDRMRQRRHAEK